MLGWVVETTVVAGLVALVALAATRHRSTTPAVRHALWLVVLLKLATPPLVAWPWAGPWRLPLGPSLLAESQDRGSCLEPSTLSVVDFDEPSITARSGSSAVGPRTPRLAARDWNSLPALPDRRQSRATLLLIVSLAWISGAAWVLLLQVVRSLRFRRLLKSAQPAPVELVRETEGISQRLGVRAPELLVVPNVGTPLLWCLGRPKLIVPAELLASLPRERWPVIVLHELAHLKRGDHWVRRLEMCAGLVWWWNPLFWLTRSRLDAEAELACDAWVVSTLPRDRLVYAEVLYDICASLASAGSPSPALGVAGAGRFVERRLTMILNDNVSCRLSPLGIIAACLLLLLSLPSWLASSAAAADPTAVSAPLARVDNKSPADSTAVMDDDDDDDEKAAKAKERKATKPKTKKPGEKAELGEASFEKKMKELGEELSEKHEKVRSEIHARTMEAHPKAVTKPRVEVKIVNKKRAEAKESKDEDQGKKESEAKVKKREQRIHEIEKQIKKLHAELKELKNQGDKDEDEDDDDDEQDKD